MRWLPTLILDCRASLLRIGLAGGCPLILFASPLRRLCTWGGRPTLLQRRWLIRPLDILLPGASLPLLLRSRLFPPRRRGRFLRCQSLTLIVLPHYGVARLVTVISVVQGLLLRHHLGIPIP